MVVDFDVDGGDGTRDDAMGPRGVVEGEDIVGGVVVRRLVANVVLGFLVFLVVVLATPPLLTFAEEGGGLEVMIGAGALDTIGVSAVVVAALVVHVVIAEEVMIPLLLYVVKMVTVVKIVLVRVVVDLSDDETYPLDIGPFDEDDPLSLNSPLYEQVARLLLVAGVVPLHIPP